MKKHFAIAFVRRVCTLVLGVSAVFLVPAHAQTAGDPNKYSTTPGNPACRFFDGFADNGDGTVTDPRNGLMWKRCAEGSTWDGKACSVAGTKMNWIEAMKTAKASRFLGHSDWRLPAHDELIGVIGEYRLCSSNNWENGNYAVSLLISHAFGSDNNPDALWSSTADSAKSDFYWIAFLRNAQITTFNKHLYSGVRLVRSDRINTSQEMQQDRVRVVGAMQSKSEDEKNKEKFAKQSNVVESLNQCAGDWRCILRELRSVSTGDVTCEQPKLSFSYEGSWTRFSGACVNGKADGWGIASKSDGKGGFIAGFFNRGVLDGFGTISVAVCTNSFWAGCLQSQVESHVGLFVAGAPDQRCSSPHYCQLKTEVSNIVRTARQSGQCEQIKSEVQKLDVADRSYFDSDLTYCLDERSFRQILAGKSPRTMFLGATGLEDKGDRGKAKTVYRELIKRFPNAQETLLASQRLTRLADVEAVESSNNSAAANARAAADSVRSQNYDQCINTRNACYAGCSNLKGNSRYSCEASCAQCSR